MSTKQAMKDAGVKPEHVIDAVPVQRGGTATMTKAQATAAAKKLPSIDDLRKAMKADRLVGHSAARKARDEETALKKVLGDSFKTPINEWVGTQEYKDLRDDKANGPKGKERTAKRVSSGSTSRSGGGSGKERIPEGQRKAMVVKAITAGAYNRRTVRTWLNDQGYACNGKWIAEILTGVTVPAKNIPAKAVPAKKAPAKKASAPAKKAGARQAGTTMAKAFKGPISKASQTRRPAAKAQASKATRVRRAS